jgi:diaminohydroxyphosphoribosylaminopyrimidine deaminase / 5-amino-6-(5-phosphoribosylamino)uracil reductase
MKIDEKYINTCIQLAKRGIGKVSPNPMVGCLIVNNEEVIGEGYHEQFGSPHAEVNAIESVTDKSLLKESTLYVNLEPCSHYGKTPPCADLIIEHKIPKVVIGCIDTFSEVSGKGIKKLEEAGIDVSVGVLKNKSIELNKRFFNFHNNKRPYVILKWAKTQDGFMDVDRNNHEYIEKLKKEASQKNDGKAYNWITTDESKKLVHHWRTEVQAIMVGTKTVLNDNPQLTVRDVEGDNPLRIVLDLTLRLPDNLRVFDGSVPTIVFNYIKDEKIDQLEFVQLKKEEDLIDQILEVLYQRQVQSILIEGGGQLLNTFIESNSWDEARVFTGIKKFKKGLLAPVLNKTPSTSLLFGEDHLEFFVND